jgi:hypothetical protein
MASQEPTRVRGAQAPPPPPAADSGIELTTLFLSAVASAAAAYITSKIWAPGTLFSAAMSPVIVALVKEGLRRPTEKVVEVVPGVVTVPRSRWARVRPDEAGLVREDPAPPAAEPVAPDAPHVILPPVVAADHGPVNVYSTRARRLRWRLAVITGLLGFAICVVLFTVPELISGQSIGRSSGHATTLFGGRRHHRSGGTTTTTTTSTTSTSTTPSTATPQRTTTPSTTAPAPSTTAPSSAAPAAPSTTAPAPSSNASPGGTAAPQQEQVAPGP